MEDLAARVSSFKESLSGNLLAPGDFVDWDYVNKRLRANSDAIKGLQALVSGKAIVKSELVLALTERPEIYPLLLDLLAFNRTGAQVEKWGLPETVGRDAERVEQVAEQLLFIGVDRILPTAGEVRDLLRIAEIYRDSNRRKFRSGKKLEDQVRALVIAAVREAGADLDETLTLNSGTIPDASLRRAFPYVISMGSRPIAAVATVFQNQSGGRQLRDLSFTYPNLQQRLSDYGASLILIADGRGVQEASDRVLTTLFEGVRYPITLREAESGQLAAAMRDAAVGELPATLDQAALNKIIEDKLRTQTEVEAIELPVGSDQARLALAAFASTRRRANLELSAAGDRIVWKRADWVRRARHLKLFFNPVGAFELFTEILGSEVKRRTDDEAETQGEISAPPVQPFSEIMHVTASSRPLGADMMLEVGRRSMERAPHSSVAIYLTSNSLDESQLQDHRKSQILRAANIIVVSALLLEKMSSDKRPLSRLLDAILTQSDLTKVSPFIISNPTPSRMFYGRVSEAATVQRTVASNSVAILGSRRMGKTSLIRRLRENLSAASFRPFFGDCQTVRTWGDFALLAKKAWRVELPDDFRPSHLELLVDQLNAAGEGQVIIILDEIDQLIAWDQGHDEDTVPEAFFRACRSVSQAGLAQFVFSGERTIANRLWDAHSPHWNFCRELQLTQLERSDAVSLLIEPLVSMNVQLPDQDVLAELAWSRTSGHPQIVQFLGDRLVKLLNARVDRRDLALTSQDVLTVTDTTEFADHYLTTYWGQATALEKAISEMIANEAMAPADLQGALIRSGFAVDHETLLKSIRMLQLYGVVADQGDHLTMRAAWFPDALAHFASS